MKETVRNHLRKLTQNCYKEIKKRYTVFIRENEDISDSTITLTSQNNVMNFTLTNHRQAESAGKV